MPLVASGERDPNAGNMSPPFSTASATNKAALVAESKVDATDTATGTLRSHKVRTCAKSNGRVKSR